MRETETRARLVEMDTCKRRTNLENTETCLRFRAERASAPRSRRGSHVPNTSEDVLHKTTTTQRVAKPSKTRTCAPRGQRRRTRRTRATAQGVRPSKTRTTAPQSRRKHTANSYHKSPQKGATERHDQTPKSRTGHQQRSEHSRK